MKRRDLLKGAAGAATGVVATTLAAPAIAQDRIEVNMGSTWESTFS